MLTPTTLQAEAGRDMRSAEHLTMDHTDSLKEALRPRRLGLNLRKNKYEGVVRTRPLSAHLQQPWTRLKQSVK